MYYSENDIPDSNYEKALMIKDMVVDQARDGSVNAQIYSQVRAEFMGDPELKENYPVLFGHVGMAVASGRI